MKYILLGKDLSPLKVTIDEWSKEEFKEMMDWDENDWETYTCIDEDET